MFEEKIEIKGNNSHYIEAKKQENLFNKKWQTNNFPQKEFRYINEIKK